MEIRPQGARCFGGHDYRLKPQSRPVAHAAPYGTYRLEKTSSDRASLFRPWSWAAVGPKSELVDPKHFTEHPAALMPHTTQRTSRPL